MTTFITIGYGDRAGYDQTDSAVRDEAHSHDARMRESGIVMGIAGTPVQVRNHDGVRVSISEGPYLRSELPIAGFSIIEADTLDDAVDIAAKAPCAVAQGVVEIWPLEDAG